MPGLEGCTRKESFRHAGCPPASPELLLSRQGNRRRNAASCTCRHAQSVTRPADVEALPHQPVLLVPGPSHRGRILCESPPDGDVGPWEELTARALAAPPPYCQVPGGPVYHL